MRNLQVLVLFLLFNFVLGCMQSTREKWGSPKDLGTLETIRSKLALFDNAPLDQRDRLYPSEKLMPGDYLLSDQRKYIALVSEEGRLLIFSKKDHYSSKKENYNTESYLEFQTDGNIVLYSSKGRPLWSSDYYRTDMCKNDCCVLILLDDGNIVAYRGFMNKDHAFWSSNVTDPEKFYGIANREGLCD